LSDPKAPGNPDMPEYVDLGAAPYIYFDMAPAHGIMAGIIQVELAARTLTPLHEGGVEVKYVSVARLRCSAIAAGHLRDAINAALKMLEESNEAPAASSRLN
jgi:hypothetical protein